MLSSKEQVINGATYNVVVFPARMGLGLKTRLIKLLAPSAFTAAGSINKNSGASLLDAEFNSEMMGKAVQALVDRLDQASVLSLVFDLLKTTRRDGKEIVAGDGALFDDIYAANYGELYKVILFVLEVNYGSFFRELGIGSLEANLLKGDKNPKVSAN